jgi:hypothetical protein
VLNMRLTCERNRGDLAEGWYDPKTLEKARSGGLYEGSPRISLPQASSVNGNNDIDDDDDDDDGYGPAPPSSALRCTSAKGSTSKSGPSHPNLQDLQVKRESAAELAEEERRRNAESMRHERSADRRVQKERLDEIAPRAVAGSRARQLEKKREKADSNRAFAASAHDSADVEVKDSDLMGGAGGIDELKRMKQVEERKRSERELRREETLSARRAEREGRAQAMREKEDKTMSMLKELARARFGGGS